MKAGAFPMAAIGSIAEVVTGTTPSTAEPSFYVGNIPFVTPTELDQDGPILSSRTYLSVDGASQARLLPEDTIMVCCIGSLGKVGISGRPLVTNQQINSLIIKRSIAEPRYVLHACRLLKPILERIAPSTTVKIVNKSRFSELEIPLPPLGEQRRIAAILDKADDLRQKRRTALRKLESLNQSIFLDMFGDPIANPKKIRVKALRDLIDLKSGEFLPASRMKDGPYPVYGGNGISGYHNEFMFEEPKIAIGRVGAYCGAVHITPSKSWITDNALYVAGHKDDLDFTYLVSALSLANFRQYAGQAAQPLISGSRIYPIEILVPNMRDQRRFAECCRAKTSTASQLLLSETSVDVLVDALEHLAFQGEL